SVADVPRVLVAFAPDGPTVRGAQLDDLALVEDVLLKLFPVVVAAQKDLAHQRVEIRLSRGDSGHRGHQTGGHTKEECAESVKSLQSFYFVPRCASFL